MRMVRLLAAASAIAFASAPALAQDQAAIAAELKAMRAQLSELEAKIALMEAAQAIRPEAPAAAPAPAPAAPAAGGTSTTWKGAPELAEKESRFSFKPKGFLQFDTGWVENPGIDTNHLGYHSRARRIVLGAEGTLPGGFGYKAEFNFAGGEVGYEDVTLTYQPKGSALQITAGNFYPLSSLETMTSSRLTSFLERAQAVEAFGFERRLGVSVGLVDPDGLYTLTGALFDGTIEDGFGNDRWQASVRATLSPRLGRTGRLHLGLSYQHRDGQSDAPALRYRARPFTQLTDIRFVDVSLVPATGDDVLGAELAAIFGPVHFASEAQQVWLDGVADTGFRSAYAEAGFFLTGETRGYRNGRWDRAKVLNPVNEGGLGALQINARIDTIDLTDGAYDGGSQTGYQLSAIWNPIDYLRFLLQYTRAEEEGGPNAPTIGGDYDADSVALRTQVEF